MGVNEAGYDKLVVVQDKDLVPCNVAQKTVELAGGYISLHSDNDSKAVHKEEAMPNVLNLFEGQRVDNGPVKDLADE